VKLLQGLLGRRQVLAHSHRLHQGGRRERGGQVLVEAHPPKHLSQSEFTPTKKKPLL